MRWSCSSSSLNDVLDQIAELGSLDDLIRQGAAIVQEEEREKAILKIMEYFAKLRNEQELFGGGEKPK